MDDFDGFEAAADTNTDRPSERRTGVFIKTLWEAVGGDTEASKGGATDTEGETVDPSRFRVIAVEDEDGDEEVWAGDVPDSVKRGDTLIGLGHWETRSDGRESFQFDLVEHRATSKDGAITWLMERLPNIGEKRAKALVAMFPGELLYSVMLDDPKQLTAIPGIDEARAQEIHKFYKAYNDDRILLTELVDLGLLPARRLYRAVKLAGIEKFKRILATDVFQLVEFPGYTFDNVHAWCVPSKEKPRPHKYSMLRDDPRVLRAYVRRLLEEAINPGLELKFKDRSGKELEMQIGAGGGDCYLDRDTVTRFMQEKGYVVGHGDGRYTGVQIAAMLRESEHLIIRQGTVLLADIDRAERDVAEILMQRVQRSEVQLIAFPPSVKNGVEFRLDDSQQYAASALVQLPVVCMTGGPGCHAKGQKLLKADGSLVNVENVQVGDRLAGYAGQVRTVLELKRGHGKMVRIHPTKGEPFVVNEDHILTLIHSTENRVYDISVKAYLRTTQKNQHHSKLLRCAVPSFDNVHKLPIDPYFLGVLLGDGTLGPTVSVCKNDQEIFDCCSEQADKWHLKLRVQSSEDRATQYYFTKLEDTDNTRVPNPLSDVLRSLGLWMSRSETKFIPHEYKKAEFSQRLALLAGLVDTDGHNTNNCIDYVSASKQLAEDVVFLARSVGFAAYLNEKTARCQTGAEGLYYRVSISGDLETIPTRIPRKQFAPRDQIKSVLRTGFVVEPAGEDDFYGFTLDGDGRYLMDDFTVTHNTGKTTTLRTALDYIAAEGETMALASFTGKAAKRMAEATGRPATTIHRLLEWTPTGFRRNAKTPIKENVVVIDEASMLDIRMASALISALGNARLLLIGDSNQLPPIGPGQPFTDILRAVGRDGEPVIPTFRLTKTHRQAGENWVIDNARKIINDGAEKGIMPSLSPVVGPYGNFGFVEIREVMDRERNTRQYADEVIRTYLTARASDPVGYLSKLQVLVPMRKKDPRATASTLNLAVQRALNPRSASENKSSYAQGGSFGKQARYRIFPGDKIIFTKNKPKLGLSNGDTGVVTDVYIGRKASEAYVKIKFDGMVDDDHPDGVWTVAEDSFQHIDLAYAMTVHKSQGSEWPFVVFIAEEKQARMLRRQLVYTAITRTSKDLKIIGTPHAMRIVANSGMSNNRLTLLTKRLLNLPI